MSDRTLVEHNIAYFDRMSKKWNKAKWTQEMTARFARLLGSRSEWVGVPWLKPGETGREVRLLDFACGHGMVTDTYLHLNLITQARGIDISPAMVSEYNARFESTVAADSKISATVGDIFATPADSAISGSDFYDFDVATISGALHHVPDPALCVRRLAERLKPQGVIIVLDFLASDHAGSEGGHGHGHHQNHQHQHHHHGPHHQNGDQQTTLHHHPTLPEGVEIVQLSDGPSPEEMSHAQQTIHKHGFSKAEMLALLGEAGYVDIKFEEILEAYQFGDGPGKGMTIRPFLCCAKKP